MMLKRLRRRKPRQSVFERIPHRPTKTRERSEQAPMPEIVNRPGGSGIHYRDRV